MKRDRLARHRWYCLLGFICSAYWLWHALRYGLGDSFPSCRGVPFSANTVLVIGVMFVASLLPLPLLLQVASATRSFALRAVALLGYAKAYPVLLSVIAGLVSFQDFPRRDQIARHCLDRPDPLLCASVLRPGVGTKRFFDKGKLAEAKRVAERARELDLLPGTKAEKVAAAYRKLREAYEAGDWQTTQDHGLVLLRLAPAYKDTQFYLQSAAVEIEIERQAGRAEEVRRWARAPGRGVASLEREARRLLPRSRESLEARGRLLRLLEEIYRRDPQSRVGRDLMHELGIWEMRLL